MTQSSLSSSKLSWKADIHEHSKKGAIKYSPCIMWLEFKMDVLDNLDKEKFFRIGFM